MDALDSKRLPSETVELRKNSCGCNCMLSRIVMPWTIRKWMGQVMKLGRNTNSELNPIRNCKEFVPTACQLTPEKGKKKSGSEMGRGSYLPNTYEREFSVPSANIRKIHSYFVLLWSWRTCFSSTTILADRVSENELQYEKYSNLIYSDCERHWNVGDALSPSGRLLTTNDRRRGDG